MGGKSLIPRENLKKKELLKHVMERWINAADTLLEMVYEHLPSPLEA